MRHTTTVCQPCCTRSDKHRKGQTVKTYSVFHHPINRPHHRLIPTHDVRHAMGKSNLLESWMTGSILVLFYFVLYAGDVTYSYDLV